MESKHSIKQTHYFLHKRLNLVMMCLQQVEVLLEESKKQLKHEFD